MLLQLSVSGISVSDKEFIKTVVIRARDTPILMKKFRAQLLAAERYSEKKSFNVLLS